VRKVPLPDDTFDIAFCQQGLQFFPDKVGALIEIRRLMRPNGRCIVCVAQELEKNPLMRSQVAAITQHINDGASAAIRAVCALSDGEVIRNMFLQAGFQDVKWETVSLTLHHDSGLEFVTNGIASTPVAGLIANWSDAARGALIKDVLAGFGDYYDGVALRFPHVSSVVTAS
jgi:SAM-dependent methyltransferase